MGKSSVHLAISGVKKRGPLKKWARHFGKFYDVVHSSIIICPPEIAWTGLFLTDSYCEETQGFLDGIGSDTEMLKSAMMIGEPIYLFRFVATKDRPCPISDPVTGMVSSPPITDLYLDVLDPKRPLKAEQIVRLWRSKGPA